MKSRPQCYGLVNLINREDFQHLAGNVKKNLCDGSVLLRCACCGNENQKGRKQQKMARAGSHV